MPVIIMYSSSDITEYYDTTRVHYNRWWKLREAMSLHYGIWEEGVKTFSESLVNTNRVMMEVSNITCSEKILDAGCGVGGAAFYLARMKDAIVTGISLSEKQVQLATDYASEKALSERVNFKVMDFTKTTFEDESFNVVWACESMCQANDKKTFTDESFRLLKKNGRLVLCDYFLPEDNLADKHSWIRKWCNAWAIPGLLTLEEFKRHLLSSGFSNIRTFDRTPDIERSSRRMFYSSLLGALPSEIYNLLHPRVSRFAKKHYKSGYYQYRAFKSGLWNYVIILAEK